MIKFNIAVAHARAAYDDCFSSHSCYSIHLEKIN
jgi:hypothetical protein